MTDNKTSKKTQEAKQSEEAPLKGRSIVLVETTAAGMAVHTAFLQEDGKLLQAPAVFPDVGYALNQIDDMRRLVIQHFSQAAQIGAQVIAAEAAKSQSSTANEQAVTTKSESK